MAFLFYIFRAAFDLAPKKFIAQFRPKMNEIIANARAEIKKKKEKMKKKKETLREGPE